MAFDGRGVMHAFPPGRYRRDPRWGWLRREMVFCLPMNEPASQNTYFAGDLLGLDDIGLARIPEVPILGGGTVARGRGPTTANPGGQYAGNAGINFPGGSLTVNNSAPAVRYDAAALPGRDPQYWYPVAAYDGLTIAMVWTNLGTDVGFRRLWSSGTAIEHVSFNNTSLRWFSLGGGNHTVGFTNLVRSVFVCTGRGNWHSEGPKRDIYQDGVLLGTSATTTSVNGFVAQNTIGATPPLFRQNGAARGYLELLLVTNRYWKADRVRLWSADPFAFLRPAPRRAPTAVFIDGAATLMAQAELEADGSVDARVMREALLRVLGRAHPEVLGAAQLQPRGAVDLEPGGRPELRPLGRSHLKRPV